MKRTVDDCRTWMESDSSAALEVRIKGPSEEIVVPMHGEVTALQAIGVGECALRYLVRNKSTASIRVPLVDWIEAALQRSLSFLRRLCAPREGDVSKMPNISAFDAARALGFDDIGEPMLPLDPPFDRATLHRLRDLFEEKGCVLIRKTGAIVCRTTGRRLGTASPQMAEAVRMMSCWRRWQGVDKAAFCRTLHAVTVPSEVNVPARCALTRHEALCLLECVECVAGHVVSAGSSLLRMTSKRVRAGDCDGRRDVADLEDAVRGPISRG